MGLKNFKIWGVFLVAIVVIAFMLFQQSNSNKNELEGQAIRNMELVKGNFLVAFSSNIDKSYQDYRKANDIQIIKKINNNDIEIIKEGIKIKKSYFSDSLDSSRYIDINAIITFNDLFNKINQHKFFDGVYLTDSLGNVIYPENAIGLVLPTIESINQESIKLPVIRQVLQFNDVDYVFYFTPVKIGDKTMILSGGIKQIKYDSIGKRIDFSYLTFLVFILCMMLFSIPLLTVFGLDKGDILTKFRVYSIGLSLIGMMVLMGFGFSFFKEHHPIHHDKHKENIDHIKGEYRRLVDKKIKLLEFFDDKPFENKNESSKYEIPDTLKTAYNDLLKMKPDGKISLQIINDISLGEKDTKYKDLKLRKYFIHFIDYEEKKVKETENDIFFSAHYSLKAAKHELVISKVATDPRVPVCAITFPIEFKVESDLMNRINLLDKPFILFRSDGLILNKSPKISAPADNLSEILSKAKLEELMAIVRNNRNLDTIDHYWNLPVFLDGFGYHATVTPVFVNVFHEPIWMIYLVDENLEHVFTSLVTFETGFLILIYLSFLALLSIHNRLLRPDSSLRQWKKFSYFYLNPDKNKEDNLLVMIVVTVLYSLIILIFYLQKAFHFFELFAIIIIITIHVKMLMYIWLGPTMGKSKFQDYFYLSTLGIILIFPLYFLWDLENIFTVWFFSIGIIVSIILSIRIKSKFELDKITHHPKQVNVKGLFQINFQHYYLMFFISWIFLIGFFPGYIFFEKVYDYEIQFWDPDENVYSRKEPEEFWNVYYEWRRIYLGKLTNSYDTIISDFIAPNRFQIRQNSDSLDNDNPTEGIFENFFKSNIKERKIKDWPIILAYLIAITLFISFVVWVTKNLIDRIYFLNSNLKIFDKSDDGLDENPNLQVFLFSNDLKANYTWIEKEYKVKKEEVDILDCLLVPGIDKQMDVNKKVWMIHNFHCNFNSETLIKKIPEVIHLSNDKIPIIISSGLSWKELNNKVNDNQLQIDYSQIFSEFKFFYIQVKEPEEFQKEFQDEFSLISHQRKNKAYYSNLWHELSFQEKKTCYYYAMEGFFNYAAIDVISELIQKGILVIRDGRSLPLLISQPFRSFILHNIRKEDIMLFKQDESKNGNVGSLQVALFSFILLSVAMISYFDKNFLDQATTFATGTAGVLGGLYSLISKAIPSKVSK